MKLRKRDETIWMMTKNLSAGYAYLPRIVTLPEINASTMSRCWDLFRSSELASKEGFANATWDSMENKEFRAFFVSWGYKPMKFKLTPVK